MTGNTLRRVPVQYRTGRFFLSFIERLLVSGPNSSNFTLVKRIYLPLLTFGLLWSCANPVPPSGGPVDEMPPRIIEEESTPDQLTNFERRSFTLEFDEWIKLKSIHQQLIVSPPLKYRPEIGLKGRTLTFTFDERDTLAANTTYTIQFGDGVVDLNEENPAEDLKFVFSTGPVIDSLSLTGSVTNVVHGTPMKDMKVMLYDRLADSIPVLERPIYISRTGEDGKFKFENLRKDTFRMIAVLDEDNDYKFSPGKEDVAFSDTLIRLNRNISGLELTGFSEKSIPKIVKRELQPDRLVLAYDQTIDTQFVRAVIPDPVMIEFLGDSLIYWLDEKQDSVLVIERRDGLEDSTWINRAKKVRRDTANITMRIRAIKKKVTAPDDSLIIPVSRSLVDIDTSKISLADSARTYRFEAFATKGREIVLRSYWINGEKVSLNILPAALTGVNGRTNKDTLEYNFLVPSEENLGSIIFTIDSLTGGPPRVVELYRGQLLVTSFTVQPSPDQQVVTLQYLEPGKYEIVVIRDRNGNGKWDTGNYLELKQPEARIRKNLEPLRENWDLNVNLQLQ